MSSALATVSAAAALLLLNSASAAIAANATAAYAVGASAAVGLAGGAAPAEAPEVFSYVVDIFFIAAFLIVYFFYKPQATDPADKMLTPEEQPNPLEAMLVTDDPSDSASEPSAEKQNNEQNS